MYGAIGPCFDEPVFMIAESTTKDGVDQFIRSLLAHRRNRYQHRPFYLVIDNHPAHIYVAQRLRDYTDIRIIKQPSESPEFNSQVSEHVPNALA